MFERFRELIEHEGHETSMHSSEGKELIESCHYHANLNTSGIIGEENIIAVHPYFDELAYENNVPEISRLENLLKTADTQRFRRILFESYLHYAKKSHELVDEGIIDKVIFTKNSEGYTLGIPIDISDLKGFSDSKVNYIGGCYGYQCVRVSSREIRKYAPFFSIRPIKDAIVYNEPVFWYKMHLIFSKNAEERDESVSFYVFDKLYSWLRGVKSSEIK
jgi:hypothetical protein